MSDIVTPAPTSSDTTTSAITAAASAIVVPDSVSNSLSAVAASVSSAESSLAASAFSAFSSVAAAASFSWSSYLAAHPNASRYDGSSSIMTAGAASQAEALAISSVVASIASQMSREQASLREAVVATAVAPFATVPSTPSPAPPAIATMTSGQTRASVQQGRSQSALSGGVAHSYSSLAFLTLIEYRSGRCCRSRQFRRVDDLRCCWCELGAAPTPQCQIDH
jgi:hypothetical protein